MLISRSKHMFRGHTTCTIYRLNLVAFGNISSFYLLCFLRGVIYIIPIFFILFYFCVVGGYRRGESCLRRPAPSLRGQLERRRAGRRIRPVGCVRRIAMAAAPASPPRDGAGDAPGDPVARDKDIAGGLARDGIRDNDAKAPARAHRDFRPARDISSLCDASYSGETSVSGKWGTSSSPLPPLPFPP
jgi:hypothetical protein